MPIDPNEMHSVAGKMLAARVNRDMEEPSLRMHRFHEVIRSFFLFREEIQINLAEAAIIWTVASLAEHRDNEKCESNFFAFIDIAYVSTDDAEKILSVTKRTQIQVAAIAVQEHLTPKVNGVLRSSLTELATLKEDNPCLLATRVLERIRRQEIEKVSKYVLCELICRCLSINQQIEGFKIGMGTSLELTAAIRDLLRCAIDGLEKSKSHQKNN